MAKATQNFPSTPSMRAFAAAVAANVPSIWWGHPGQAKSAKTSAYAEAWNRHLETVIGSVRESSDYLGLPIESDGGVNYAPPAWAMRLNAAEKGLLFLDELTTAAPSVQKAMLRILQERFVGEYALGDHVAIVAAANPPETAADGWDLPAPVANRLMHLDWHFDADEWLNGVVTDFAHTEAHSMESMTSGGSPEHTARVKGQIAAFLRHMPNLIAPTPPMDPVQAGKAWPSPRSWDNAMKVMSHVLPGDDAAGLLVMKGCVGDAAATEFYAWLAVSDLADPSEVMDDPSIVNWKGERPDRLFALTTGVATLALLRGDKENWSKGMKVFTACAEAGKPDVAMPGARTLLDNKGADWPMPKGFRESFTDLLVRAGQMK